MKKLLYTDAPQIETLAEFFRQGWTLFDCAVDGSTSHQTDHRTIQLHFENAERLRGSYPSRYILAKRNAALPDTRLSTVIAALKLEETTDAVALVGYNDGGLIALFSDGLPLPGMAQDAIWWTGKGISSGQ
ncbi:MULTISPECIES: hypothetical protein [unclassified Rhizobium]|uniref:hypothetical protein n=1 Tax=unclassified Rhizobium TaxID=2613769 RepID=UPI002889191A|nr:MULTISPECIES: hypothetical protein [unclassified Rhizobium]